MKKALFTLIWLVAASTGLAQECSCDDTLERERLELEKERLELEKKRYELEHRIYMDSQQEVIYEYIDDEDEPHEENLTSPFTKEFYVGFDFIFAGHGDRTYYIDGVKEAGGGILASGGGVKLGYGKPDKGRMELSVQKKSLEYDNAHHSWDVTLYSFDYLFLFYEALEEKHLSPYVKIGLSLAQSDDYLQTVKYLGYSTDSEKSTISGSGLNLGMGLCYLIDENVEASLGMDYVTISWQELLLADTAATHKVEIDDTLETYFLNLNYYF